VLDNQEGIVGGSLPDFARQVCASEKTDGLLLLEKSEQPDQF